MLSGISYLLFSYPHPVTPAQYFAYMKRRLATLFPVFFLVNVALYGGSFLYVSGLGRPYTFAEFLASATGTSMFFGWKYLSTVMWFVPFILQVYLLLPLIDWGSRRLPPLEFMLVAFGVSCLTAQLMPFFFADQAAYLVCKNWSPLFRLPEVCLGILLGRLALAQCDFWKAGSAMVTFGILSWLVSWLNSIPGGTRVYIYMPWSGFWVPLLLFGAAYLILPLRRNVQTRLIRQLGIATFAFYLFHAAPLTAIEHRFGNHLPVWAAYYLACWVIAVSLTRLVARATKLFEPSRQQT